MNTRAFLFSLVSSVVGGSSLAKAILSSTGGENALSFDPHLYELPETQTSGIVPIGSCAQVDLPPGFDFVSRESFERWMRKIGLGNIPVPERGRLSHDQSGWYAHIEYCDEGHLLDDEKDRLDADAILKVLRQKERDREPLRREFNLNFPRTNLLGFELSPRYDEQSHLLEWATRSITEGETAESVTHEALVLCRRGVVQLQRSCAPGKLDSQLPAFRTLLEHFRFEEGEAYSDYELGDKLAPYGLIQAIIGPHERGLPASLRG